MLVDDPMMFAAAASGRLLGLDHGAKTIGLAISDAERRLAVPIATIRRGKWAQDLAALQRVIAARGVGGLVIGYPLNMDGTPGPRCQSVRAFVRNLEPAIALPMLLWDERLSSAAAEEKLREVAPQADKLRHKNDQAAATIILQSLLDAYRVRPLSSLDAGNP